MNREAICKRADFPIGKSLGSLYMIPRLRHGVAFDKFPR